MQDARPIIRLLQQSQWASVSELAQTLSFQRREVEEGIAILKHRGIGIEYDAGSGYRLTNQISLIDEHRLVEYLDHAGLVTAGRLTVLDTVESTNNQLLQWMDRDTLHGRACIAEYQLKGRGRHGRSWFAAPYCNVALSLAWKTECELALISSVSLAAGLAVARVLERTGLTQVQLKWPNDIVFDQGKLGGILVEVKRSPDNGCDIVVGVGVNLNNPAGVLKQVGQAVTNLQDVVNTQLDRTQLIGEILVELSIVLENMDRCSFASDAAEWNQRDAYLGLGVVGYLGDRQIRGEGLGIDESGAYRVRDSTGCTHLLISGEVTMLRVQTSCPANR